MRGSQFIGAGWRRHFSVTGCSLVALPLQNHMLMAYCALLYNICVLKLFFCLVGMVWEMCIYKPTSEAGLTNGYLIAIA